MIINTAPPFCPVIYGKRHIFPNPTAEPAVAKITPSLLPKLALSSLAICTFLIFWLQNYKIFLNFAPKKKKKYAITL
jgi:hypothetical protein